MKPCIYCGKTYKENGVRVHELTCKLNPNPISKIVCCCLNCGKELSRNNIKRHIQACTKIPVFLICPQCGIRFEEKFGLTCSTSCANKYFHKGPIPLTDEELITRGRYRDICFRYYEKKCIICGEQNIVGVHHYNGNPIDHRPENLVPLCPTHHKYLHSFYKNLIFCSVVLYMKNWIKFGKFKSSHSDVAMV